MTRSTLAAFLLLLATLLALTALLLVGVLDAYLPSEVLP